MGYSCLDTDGIYHRENYRHKYYRKHEVEKTQRLEKIVMDLAKNITIMRVEPHYVSISGSYLLDLEAAMDELSRGELLQMAILKY